ncbi:DUF4347 domain-containing protein [Aquabacterium sp.]|uniref:DUF4347 domain-containing protein n=1 Tax=Aquabacterium sp. TaxID=1872578 RepID=UPI0035B4DC86
MQTFPSAQYVQSAVVAAQAGSATTDAAAQQRVELVFVDSGVTDASHLVADLQAQRGDGRTLLVFTLDAAQDGLKQISDVLARYQATQGQGGVDAVHLITHGDAQGLQIGSTWLNADNLMQHAAQIAGWGASLNTHADLLLYGCDLAASATGRLLADDLGLLTGADVAASTNVTGAAAQGGDWTLEYAHGAINAQVAANAATQADWQGTLLLTASGSETRVNTTTSGTQTTATNRQVAIDGSGNSVAVWQTGTTIYGQRFDSTGAKVGSEFKMSTSGGLFNSVNNPQVAMNASGAYAVTWYEYNPGLFGILLPSWTVYLQRFNAAGVSQGVTKVFDNLAFLTFSGDPQMYSAVSMDASGNIAVVSREDSEVDIEWYNSSGTKTGAARVDDSSNSNTKTEVSVSTTTAGTVVTWTESGTEIVGQLYNASHVAVGGNFRVNTTTSGSQTQSSVGMDGTGAFVVSWTSTQGGTSDIYAQRFSNAGAKVGSEFLVNNTTAYDQTASSVAVDGGGAFVIAWQSNLQDGSGTGIYMRQYQSDGFAGLYDQRVNTTTTNAQSTPSVAVNGTRAVVLWNGNGTGDSSGVFAQRFTVGTNQAPTATLGASNLNYTENAGALALDSAATLTDADNSTLQGATVQITGNYVSSEDVLAFTNALGITGSWNASTGTLTLSGVALVSSYQTALRSITYTNTSDNPSAAVRTVSVSVTDGQLGSGVATKTITVLPVNDAPTISAPSVWIVPVGIGANITGITITDLDAGTGLVTLTLTAAGGVFNATSAGGVTVGGDGTAALTLQGQVSDINAFIAASSLGVSSIQYTGATSVSLQLAVDDGGNTGSGGAQTVSWNAAISTVAFTPPSLVAPATLTALEDTPTQLTGWTVSAPHAGSNSIQLTLTAGAGTLSATSGGGVTVSNPVAGTLVLVGSVDNLNTFIANGLVGYQGATDANGNVNLTLLLDDLAQNPAGVNLYANASLTIAITPVNDAPQGSSGTVTMFEDHARTFTAADFGFTDPQDSPADALLGVYIDSLPGAGTLALNGVAVQAGDFVAATSLGSLAFTPAASANGAGYASFTFRVRDSGGTANGGADTDLTSRTLAIDVAAINSAPQGTDAIATMLEDASYTFSAADFGFTDPQDPTPNALLGVVISSLPAAGTLTVSGVAVQDGDLIAVANLGNLVYTPEANGFGAAHASFTFQVRDDGGTANGGADTDLTPRTMTLSVTAVNDAPQAADGTVLTMQKTAYTFQVADFGFTDVTDAPSANALQAIRVVSLPSAGVLTLQGAAVTAGQVVLASEIAAGHLQFAPTGDDHGTPYAHFTFQVQDNGGTANGGVDWDATVHTLTINVVTPDSAVPALTLPPLADTHIEAGAAAVKVVATVAAAPAQPANDAGIGGGRFGEFAVRALNVDVVQAAYAIDANTGLAETGRGYAADWLAEAGKPAPIQWLLDQIQNQRQTASDGVASTAARQQLVQWTDGSEAQSLQGVAASVKSGGVAVSVGMVWWATRLSGLVTGLMASTPAWRSLDPLPILGGTADESDDDDQGFGPTESGEDSDFEHEAAKGRRARPKAGDLFAHGAPSAGQLGNGGAGR